MRDVYIKFKFWPSSAILRPVKAILRPNKKWQNTKLLLGVHMRDVYIKLRFWPWPSILRPVKAILRLNKMWPFSNFFQTNSKNKKILRIRMLVNTGPRFYCTVPQNLDRVFIQLQQLEVFQFSSHSEFPCKLLYPRKM